MENSIRRFVVAFLVFTGALWGISISMSANGFDFVQNPAWVLIHVLRSIFTSILILGFFGVTISIFGEAILRIKNERKKGASAEQEKSGCDFLEIKSKEEQMDLEKIRVDDEHIKIEEQKLEAEKRNELREKLKASPADAVQKAPKDFI